jgi:hypothetical protein
MITFFGPSLFRSDRGATSRSGGQNIFRNEVASREQDIVLVKGAEFVEE